MRRLESDGREAEQLPRPGKAAAYPFGRLPKRREYVFELQFGRKRFPAPGGAEAAGQPAPGE